MSTDRPRQITTFDALWDKTTYAETFFEAFIIGHLMIEFMLGKIISQHNSRLNSFTDGLNHKRKIDLAHGLDLITEDQKASLIAINSMRNKMAHNIAYVPSVSEYQHILQLAEKAFVDMTDGIEQSLAEIQGKSSLNDCEGYIYAELFMQILYDLHQQYTLLGGDMENFH